MNKKLKKTQRKQAVEQYKLEHPPTYTEGHWEETMLENNSYWDIDYLEKVNAKTNKGIKYWEERYTNASSNMGKWYCQIRIDRLKSKLKHYENKS
jgi:hypothetical protein